MYNHGSEWTEDGDGSARMSGSVFLGHSMVGEDREFESRPSVTVKREGSLSANVNK